MMSAEDRSTPVPAWIREMAEQHEWNMSQQTFPDVLAAFGSAVLQRAREIENQAKKGMASDIADMIEHVNVEPR